MGILSPIFPPTERPPLWISGLFTQTPAAMAAEQSLYAAMGRFISAYALAEAGVHVAARHYSGLTEDNARVIFGGMRLSNLAEKLRKLTANSTEFDEIDMLLRQLDDISQERDKIVHRLVEYDPKEGLRVTDKLTVKSVASTENRTFGVKELGDMERDCVRIYFRLTSTITKLDGPQMTKYGLTLLGLFGPWQYKRPPQAKRTKPPRANARSHRNRRHASHAKP